MMPVLAALGRDTIACFWAALLALGWTLAGFVCLPKRLLREAPLLIWSTSMGIGAGGTAVAVVVLAGLHLLGRGSVWAVLAVVGMGAIAGARRVRQAGVKPTLPQWRAIPPLVRLGALCLALVLGLGLVATLAPPSSMDATVYHLQEPREFLRTGSWMAHGVIQSYYPLNVEMLFAVGLVVGGPTVAALVHWVLGLGALLAAAAWARELTAPEEASAPATSAPSWAPFWAAAALGGTALFVWESTSAFIDLGTALWGSLALLWATRIKRGVVEMVLAGVLGGLAAGSKLIGPAIAAIVAVGALAAATRRLGARAAASRLVAVGGLSMLVALPWYIRTWQLTGNPIYPLGIRLLGGPGGVESVIAFARDYGYGRGPLHLLLSPLDLLARSERFSEGWSIGPALLALAPLGFASAGGRVRLIAAAGCVAWWVIWFFGSPQTRLLLPFVPVAAGFAGVGMAAACRRGRWLGRAATAAMGITFVEGLGAAALSAWIALPVVLGLESQEAFLSRHSWSYVAFAETNKRLDASAHVAVEGATNLFHLQPPATMVDLPRPSGMELRARGFTHNLLVQQCPLAPTPQDEATLWEGRFPLRTSRLKGGVTMEACARLTALPGS